MSDNPLIEGFLKIHEAGGIGGGISGTKFSNAASYAPAVRAGVLGAVDNITMGAVTNPEAREKYPVAYKTGDAAATVAQVATGVGAAKALAGVAIRKAARSAADNATTNATRQFAAKDFELGAQNTLGLTPQMRVPRPTLKLTQQMRTEEENESSKGNTEMSINPFIKGFFDIEEARAKNTNIFDESKKLTAAQKKHLDKNDNDKIDAEDFKMLRKEETIKEADLSDFKRKSVPGLYNFDHFEHPDGSFIQVSPYGHGVYQDAKGNRKDFTSIQHLKTLFKEEADLDEAKKTNSMVMARNISKVLKAAKPDFLDIDKDGDKEEPMKKAAADMKKEEVEFSEEEIDFINSVMEAMPVAPTSEGDSPNPTPKKKAEGSRAKGSMAD